MIYTIGYQGMKSVEELVRELKKRDITHLVDIRSKPVSRWKPAFNQKALADRLPGAGICYMWKGKQLGGFAEIEEKHIKWLACWQKNKTACLMCMEADPDRCHRKYEVGARLEAYDVRAMHIMLRA